MATIWEDEKFLNKCKQNREELLSMGMKVQSLIEKRQWNYPLDKFQAEIDGFNKFCSLSNLYYSFPVRLTVLFIYIVVFGLPVVLSPSFFNLIFVISLAASLSYYSYQIEKIKSKAERFITHLERYQKGEITTIVDPSELNPATSSKSSQIKELHELLKSGALTQEEFDSEKKKILKDAA